MTHIWLRAEQRDNEERVGLTPDGARTLIAAGVRITVETSQTRIIPNESYRAAGCEMAPENHWPGAPDDAIIFGLKELPADKTPLSHRHIMFGHAYKNQPAGRILLDRFKAGGGQLLDLEYLTDGSGRRVAAFGYWAGFAGAAVALKCWIAQQGGGICGPIHAYPEKSNLVDELAHEMQATKMQAAEMQATGRPPPDALIIGALGRVGTGAADLCAEMGVAVTKWDMAETAAGGPFPEILEHALFFNCILARKGTPVFVPKSAINAPRALSVIGDIACDPDSDFSPIKVYDHTTTWDEPALRVHDTPPLDVTAIDNLPSMLPVESSQDYAAQLLPTLLTLDSLTTGVWGRAKATFDTHMKGI